MGKLHARIRRIKLLINCLKEDIYAKHVFKNVKSIGCECKAYGKNIQLLRPDKLSIGNEFKINGNTVINARGGVIIGNGVTVSDGAKILSTGYDLEEWKKSNTREHKNEPVNIGDDVWICASAVICPGVTISGSHVVVGAGAVVTRDIEEDNCIVAGIPAKIVSRF